MGGLIVPRVFEKLPFDLDMLFPELDGTFPNHPGRSRSSPRTSVTCGRVSRRTGADVGLAFDGDADRVFLVDEQGRGLSGSTTTAMLASRVLDEGARAQDHPQPHLLEGGARGHPRARRRTDAHAGRPLLHQGGDGRDRRRVRRRALGALLLPRQLPRRLRASSPRCSCSKRCRSPTSPLSELRRPFERYADSGEINTEVDRSAGDDRAGRGRTSRRRRAGPPRRAHRRLRRLVVQPAAVEHRAAAAPQPRGGDTRGVRRHVAEVLAPRRRLGLSVDDGSVGRWRSIRCCSRSSPAPRTRARSSTSTTRTSLYNPRLQAPVRGPRRHPDHAHRRGRDRDDAEHDRLMAKVEAEGHPADVHSVTARVER